MSESPWEKDHSDQWERENKRAAQERHEEKFWSEIVDGVAHKTPDKPIEFQVPDDHEKFKDETFEQTLQRLKAYFEKGKK